jgi:hypothetical protein
MLQYRLVSCVIQVGVEIRPADTTIVDLEENLIGTRLRDRDIFNACGSRCLLETT